MASGMPIAGPIECLPTSLDKWRLIVGDLRVINFYSRSVIRSCAAPESLLSLYQSRKFVPVIDRPESARGTGG
jgi:hypothetical protein